MTVFPRCARGLFASALLLAGAASAAADAKSAAAKPAARPDPALAPAAVVQIQLEALKHVDEPAHDAGFAIVFAFASPGNQRETGPVEHFAQMIRASYSDLLYHRSATLAPTRFDGDTAIQAVDVIDRGGSAHRYVFLLSKQADERCKGCWLTDSVYVDPRQQPKVET